jgi:hypothetical protein
MKAVHMSDKEATGVNSDEPKNMNKKLDNFDIPQSTWGVYKWIIENLRKDYISEQMKKNAFFRSASHSVQQDIDDSSHRYLEEHAEFLYQLLSEDEFEAEIKRHQE